MAVLDQVTSDLAAESDELETLLIGLASDDWRRPTPSPGWSVANQVAHLNWTDDVAIVAMTDPDRLAALKTGQGIVDPRSISSLDPADQIS